MSNAYCTNCGRHFVLYPYKDVVKNVLCKDIYKVKDCIESEENK